MESQETPSKPELVENASQGLVIDYYSLNGVGVTQQYGILTNRNPLFDPKRALDLIRNDPVVKAAIITKVDHIMQGGWHLEGRDKRSKQASAEQKLRDLRFSPVLRKALYNLFLYNNAYIEIVKKASSVSELHVLETTLMRVNSDDHGEVISFYELAPQPAMAYPKWDPDGVVHLKLGEITTNIYADTDLQALYDTVLIKDFIRQYVQWFFGTNQLRPVYAFKTKLNTQNVKEFIGGLKAGEKDLKRPHIFEGEGVFGPIMSWAKEGSSVHEIMRWCDEQILALLQVPPIAIGLADQSGRSNSVELYKALDVYTKSVENYLEDTFSYELLPKMDFPKIDFRFGTMDLQSVERIMNLVQVMKNAQMTDDAIMEVLEGQGITFDTKDIFEDPMEMAQKQADLQMKVDSNKSVGTGNEGSIGNKSADGAPSRQRQNNSSVSKANQKEMVRNSNDSTDKFNQFPYVI